MKKRIYKIGSVLFISLVLLNGCKKDEKPDEGGSGNVVPTETELQVEEDQNSLYVDLTATWCGPCGANGTPTFKKLTSEHASKVVGLAIHTNNSELTPHYSDGKGGLFVSKLFANLFSAWNIQTNNGSYGIPAMSVNGTHYPNWSESTLLAAIEAKATTAPVANVALKAEKTAGGIKISTKTKFFSDASGEYKLGLYVVSKEVSHRQYVGSTYQDVYTHKHILRASAYGTLENPNYFGEIISTNPAAGSEFKLETEFNTPDIQYPGNTSPTLNRWTFDPDATEIVAIIWKRNGGSKYEFVNVQRVDVK